MLNIPKQYAAIISTKHQKFTIWRNFKCREPGNSRRIIKRELFIKFFLLYIIKQYIVSSPSFVNNILFAAGKSPGRYHGIFIISFVDGSSNGYRNDFYGFGFKIY